ncbi:MAG: adenylate/guanylate cyclase domain-containing protein, partial [Planctomycetota bacterium]|nr:adenylate/guanylate cyclase domain-containing protein [Planctomycetota bacterium]
MRYIPGFIEKNYDHGTYRGDFRCTALFVDISGFTRLTETAFALGERGAEFMSRQLRHLFDEPVNAVVARNGIITNFAGDAFTALFPGDDGQQAFSAAGDVIRFFAENGRPETPDGVFDFNARCGIAAGEVTWGIPRDSLGRCGYYFLGAPILEAAGLVAHCAPGQIEVSQAIPAASRVHFPSRTHGDARAPASLGRPNHPEVLSRFIQDEVLHLGRKPEIRPVTSVFMSFGQSGSQEMRAGVEGYDEVGRLLSVVRDECISGGGTFNKLDFGDKGMTALCFFGAPKAPDRPIVAALRFVERLRARLRSELPEIRVCVGVDAGLAYCGITGGELRNEWTCLGNSVNTAARLMSLARWDETAVSGRIKEDASRFFGFFPLGRHALKGKSGLEAVFSCRRHAGHATAFAYERPMLGRQAELNRLLEIAGAGPAAPERRGFAGMVYVFGEPGMGKTRLVQEFRRQLEESNLPRQWVHLQCLENDPGLKPLSVWLERFLEVTALGAQEEGRRKIEAKIDALARRATTTQDQQKELRRAVSFLGALVECF